MWIFSCIYHALLVSALKSYMYNVHVARNGPEATQTPTCTINTPKEWAMLCCLANPSLWTPNQSLTSTCKYCIEGPSTKMRAKIYYRTIYHPYLFLLECIESEQKNKSYQWFNQHIPVCVPPTLSILVRKTSRWCQTLHVLKVRHHVSFSHYG